MRRWWAVLVGLCACAPLGLSGCTGPGASSPSSAPGRAHASSTTAGTGAPQPSTTGPPTTLPQTDVSFSVASCGGIVTDHDLDPSVDLRPLLLTASDAPAGYSRQAPNRSGTTRGTFVASVPSIVPVATVDFRMGASASTSGQSSTRLVATETVGEVGSAAVATGAVRQVLQAATQADCLVGGSAVPLPGSVPGLTAVESTGSSRAGSLAQESVIATKGPYTVVVRWVDQTSQGSATQTIAPSATLPPLGQLATVVDAALGRLPG